MGRALGLSLAILLALASVAGYLFLTGKITAGERQLADGQGQLEAGRLEIEAGKAKLDTGKQELLAGRKEFEQARQNPLSSLADKVLKGGKGFDETRKRIAAGDTQVARAEDELKVGERRLAAGETELRSGKERLRRFKAVRVVLALGAGLLALLSIMLGIGGRRGKREVKLDGRGGGAES